MQKNVYGASVIVFEGIMSFADKELLEVRPFVWFEAFSGAADVNVKSLRFSLCSSWI